MLAFRWSYMWDPEYCDTQLRAVEASGESRDELCPSTPENTAENQSQADAWYTCDQCLAVAQRHHGQDMLLGLPIISSTSSRPRCLAGCLQSRLTSYCIILHKTVGGTTHCVKQNNIIIFLYGLMLHTLINKILHVTIME